MERMERKKILFVVMAVVCLAVALIWSADSFAAKGLKPETGPDGNVTGFKEEPIPDYRVPLGVNEAPNAVGVFGCPSEEKTLKMVTPEMTGVNTKGWEAKDYVQFQCSYLGMEIKPMKDYCGDFQFDLIDSQGRSRTRKVYQFRKPYYGENGVRYKNMVYFFEPPDLKGMSILVVKPTDENKADDNWIYLPALRRVRQIAAAQKMDSFGGTDMTNDQIDRATGMWDYKMVGEMDMTIDKPPVSNCYGSDAHRYYMNNQHCVMVELTPKNKDWPVSKEVAYYNKETAAWLFEETYDKGGKLIKIMLPMLAHMYPKNWKYWAYGDWYGHDLRTNHKTFMTLAYKDATGKKTFDYVNRDWSNYIFWYDTGYSDEYTSKEFMMRGTR